MKVANSIILYEGEISAETRTVKKRVNSLVLVTAGTIIVELLAAERIEIYKAKSS